MASLTSEQLARIEENRKKALAKRAMSEQLARIEENRKKALAETAMKERIESNRRKALIVRAIRKNETGNIPLSAFKINPNLNTSPSVQAPKASDSAHPPPKKIKEDILSVSSKQFCIFQSSRNLVTGHCQLISKVRFEVNVKYHPQLIDIFKKRKSANYDSANKMWNFHVSEYDELMKELVVLKNEVTIHGIPWYILNLFLKPPVDYKEQNIDISAIDQHLLNRLMPFQKEGILFGVSRKGRCLIADDMGLGKTVQALGIAHYFQSDWPLLIVCPTSVRFQWMEAVRDWLPSVSSCSVSVMTSGKDFDSEAKILITSYALISRHAPIISSVTYGVVIVDESHFLKSHSSARTKAVCGIIKKSKRVILLSGTPALSRPAELFTQINAIDPVTFPYFREFGIRYCDGKQTNMGFWDYSGCSNMKELQLILEQSIMIRRLKSNVLHQLPAKLRHIVILNGDNICSNKLIKSFEKRLQNSKLKGMERRGTLLQYYAESGVCKLPAILDYLNDQLESEKKFIVFAHHKVVMDGICSSISKSKIDFIRIDGSTSAISRKELCDKFQFSDRCLVAVLSITAANAGITLTAAQLVIFAELFWNPGILTQAEDRAHRIGQEDCVLVQYLVAPGTADDHIWPLIQSKLEVLNKAGLSKDSFQSCSSSVVTRKSTDQNITDFFNILNDGDDDSIMMEALKSLQ